MTPRLTAEEAELVTQIKAHGFTVRFVDYCEDQYTPGFLGAGAGVTDFGRREVKIGLVATGRAEPGQRAKTLAHELRHVADPDWDCGSRNGDVFERVVR